MKIAVVSSGLGHVARGIETWANDLGVALHRRGAAVTLFKGGGTPNAPYEQVIPCAQRDKALAKFLYTCLHRGGWRFGFGSPYQIEQTTFARSLIPKLQAGDFAVVHMQDPWVAHVLEKARRQGRHRAAVILAHGTEEPLEFLREFDHVQELAPCYLEEDQRRGIPGKHWCAIPNFVDVDRFSPAVAPLSRAEIGVPADAFLILGVAAIKRTHKRVDVLIEEVAQLRALHPDRRIHLVVAGAREKESEAIIALGKERLGDAITFLANFNRSRMPALFRTADVLAHASLVEMMPIALLEAIASGLPVVGHQWPSIQWIIGDGGTCVDASRSGTLSRALADYLVLEFREAAGRRARERAVTTFSEEVIVRQILEMYGEIANQQPNWSRATLPASKREQLARGLAGIGILPLLERFARRPSLIILNYHRIGDVASNQFDDALFSASTAEFERQVRYLRDHFKILRVAELAAMADDQLRVSEPSALVTFDDGYRDNLENAFPILQKLGMSAAFFIPTEFLERPRLPWWDHIAYVVKQTRRNELVLDTELSLKIDLQQTSRAVAIRQILQAYKHATAINTDRLLKHLEDRAEVKLDGEALGRELFLSPADLRQMAAAGMEIGSHTHSHQILGQLSESEQQQELSRSKTILESILGNPVLSLAYPVGNPRAFTAATKKLAREIGYKLAFSFYGGVNQPGAKDFYDLKRGGMDFGDSLALFRTRAVMGSAFGRTF